MKKYYIKQKISGAIIALIGILTPILDNGNATFTLLALPFGIYLMLTKVKVMYCDEKFTGIRNDLNYRGKHLWK